MAASPSNPIDELKRKKDELEYKINNLRDEASLKSVINEFTDLESNIANLSSRILALRQRKYAFNTLLEKTAADIQNRWTVQREAIESKIAMQANVLQSSLHSIDMRFNALGAVPAAMMLQMLSNEAESFEERCSSTKSSIEELFNNIQTEVSQFMEELRKLEYSQDQVESASFGFLPTESVILAVKAIWCKSGKEEKDDPEGVLFLTDQRLLFEQKQEIATKKVLFVTTEKQKVQQLLFEAPVVSIEDVKTQKLGLFKNQDILELRFSPGNFLDSAILHIYQNCEEWQKMILKAKVHEYDSQRVIAVDQAAVEKMKTAPTQCPNCGGAITKPVLRGMDTITCEFCGKVIRL